jgi:hypothetical protein
MDMSIVKEIQMGINDFKILVVHKSGPVQSITVRRWWIKFIFIFICLLAAVLAAGSYVFYRQYLIVGTMIEENGQLSIRIERLEGLMRDQETREVLLSQQQATPVQSQAMEITSSLMPEENTQARPDEPASSPLLSIRNMEQHLEQGDMRISFDVVNEQDNNEPAVGYIAVVAHGSREGNPWIEVWPPMRLNASGRPEQYRRGTPFSVQRFRTIQARIPIADKLFERIELLFYSRQGELILVKSYPVLQATPATQ